jgi:hypothetical protein
VIQRTVPVDRQSGAIPLSSGPQVATGLAQPARG